MIYYYKQYSVFNAFEAIFSELFFSTAKLPEFCLWLCYLTAMHRY